MTRINQSILLVALLLAAYTLAYVSAPLSADGQALLAVADTAVEHGRFDINVIGHTEWLLTEDGRMGSFGLDDALYSKKGLTPSLALMPLVALAQIVPGLGTRATAMLFNLLITALTALALAYFARRLGYRDRTAFVLALIYGLATLAAVYVKTLFGEPLAALLLLLVAICAHTADSRALPLRIAGLCLGLLVGVNTIYVLFIPVIALYVFWRQLLNFRAWINFLLPLGIVLALLALYNWTRFGSPLESGYHFDSGEGFNNPLLVGLYGLFFSPYRGIFWYSPLLLLCIPGWLIFRRSESRLSWLIVVLVALQALAFAGWWSWHGGIVWGPRFLLPALPLAALLLAPLIEDAFRKPWLALVLAGFSLLSLLIQVLGILFNYLYYENTLRLWFYPDLETANQILRTSPVMFNPAYSPILGHLALLRTHWPLEPAWLKNGVDVAYPVTALLITIAGIIQAVVRQRIVQVAVLVTIAVGLLVVASRQEQTDAAALSQALTPPGTVVVASLLLDDVLLDVDNGAYISSMNAPSSPDDSRTQTMWRYALEQTDPFWFVSWFGPADPLNWQERDLWQSAYFVKEQQVAQHRAVYFDRAPDPDPTTPGGWQFGPITLDSYAITRDSDGLRVRLQWSAAEPIDANYSWFVHVIDHTEAIIAQQDRTPQGGYAPTSGWQPGEPITDRLLFPLLADTDTTNWQIRIGWLENGERLPVYLPDGSSSPPGFALLPVLE